MLCKLTPGQVAGSLTKAIDVGQVSSSPEILEFRVHGLVLQFRGAGHEIEAERRQGEGSLGDAIGGLGGLRLL